MNATIAKASALWGFQDAPATLIAQRENRVYRVDAATGRFALRLHRPGLRTSKELWSELQWTRALSDAGVRVPEPVPSREGAYLHAIDGIDVDVQRWIDGAPLGRSGEALALADTDGTFHSVGREMARLHAASDAWTAPPDFVRPAWDRTGLLGGAPLWDRFWDNPTLSDADRRLFVQTREAANRHLAGIESMLDFGLIHADMLRENLMFGPAGLHIIDFDDSGFGFRLFDLATALVKNMDEPDYATIRAALLAGYGEVRDIDLTELDFFILLRALTYVGWVMSRMSEPGSEERNRRFIALARRLATRYLDAGTAGEGG